MMPRSAFTVIELLVVLVIGLILAGLFPAFTPFSAFWMSVFLSAFLLTIATYLFAKRLRKTSLIPFVAAIALIAYNAPTIPLMDADSYTMSGKQYVNKPLKEVLASEVASGTMALPVRFWVDPSIASEQVTLDTRGMQLGEFLSLLTKQVKGSSEFRWKTGCGGGICNPYAASVTLVSGTPTDNNNPDYERCLVYIDESGIEDFSIVAGGR